VYTLQVHIGIIPYHTTNVVEACKSCMVSSRDWTHEHLILTSQWRGSGLVFHWQTCILHLLWPGTIMKGLCPSVSIILLMTQVNTIGRYKIS